MDTPTGSPVEPYTLATLPWEGWLVLLLTLLAFAGMGVWLAFFARRPHFPRGRKYTEKYLGHEATTVIHPKVGISGVGVAKACAVAVWASAASWEENVGRTGATKAIRRVCVYVTNDVYFDAHPYRDLKNAAAFLISARASIGDGIPMAVIREKYVDQILETGEPVIHEMMHALLGVYTEPDKDRDHSNKSVWTAHRGQVQTRARELYAVERVNRRTR